MTIMIVAILNGKSQDEWYNWVTDRVQNKHGYQTPETLPQLYSTSRLMSFKVKREAYEQRQRERREREERDRENGITPMSEPSAASLFGGFANILGGDGSLILNASPDDDDDDESDDDDMENQGINARSLLSSAGFGFGGSVQLDMTKSLREQLQELDDMGAFNEHDVDMNDIEDGESGVEGDTDDAHAGDAEHEAGSSDPESPTYTYDGQSTASASALGSRGGETPPPPPTPPNGDATPVQLKSLPQGDAPSGALKVEGFLDSSESPLKV